MRFFTYPKDTLPDLSNYVLLKVGAPPLEEKDCDQGIFLIDGSWRYASVMEKQIPDMKTRSLPGTVETAYPRKQTECPDPEKGLASIEALYLAYLVTKRPLDGLLDHYHWKKDFLEKNGL